jgi:dTDP-L-rhamnose 4-epimerase
MRVEHVLVTGGAGFIGSHLCDALVQHGYRVRVIDNLDPQVHPDAGRPAYLNDGVELVVADVRDIGAVQRALDGIDSVVHLAAKVGVGQSMYEIAHYTDANELGTATLLQALVGRPLRKLVVASSMSIYGEGLMRGADGLEHERVERRPEDVRQGRWEPLSADGEPLTALPTPERKRPMLHSVYALNKFAQERMCLMVGGAAGIKTVALRFFNVYGPRQALSNPYTGVIAIFASRLLNRQRPVIFEDGRQRRDFVHVRDVAAACRLALERDAADGEAINIGSGRSVTVAEIARRLARAMASPLGPDVSGRTRVGDIRHCFADIALAGRLLGYAPQVGFEDGLAELVEWLTGQSASDHTERALGELERRGLVV